MSRKIALILFFAIALNNIVFAGSADGRSGYCLKELSKAKNIVIVANDKVNNKDYVAKMDSLNIQLSNAVKKYWKATKANFVNKNLSSLTQTDLTDVYISLMEMSNGEMACIFFSVTKKGQIESWPSYHLQLLLQKDFNEVDIVWAVRQLNEFAEQNIAGTYDGKLRMTGYTPTINYRLVKNNLGKLKTKTLLIDKDFLPDGMTEEKIKRAYSYKVKISNKAEIQEAVLSASPNYAYIQRATNHTMGDGGAGGDQVISTQDGHMLSYCSNYGLGGWEKALKECVKNSETYP